MPAGGDSRSSTAATAGQPESPRTLGWIGLAVAAVTSGLTLLAWPLHWWDPLVRRWDWYPTSVPIGVLGLLLCLGSALALMSRPRRARLVFAVTTALTVLSYIYYLVTRAGAHAGPSPAVASGGHPDPWEHPAPGVIVMLALAGVAGIFACGRGYERAFAVLTTTFLSVSAFLTVGALYGVGLATLSDSPRLSLAPGLTGVGLGLAIASARPRLNPIRGLRTISRRGLIALVVIVANILLVPLAYRALTSTFSKTGVDRPSAFALTVIVVVLIAEAVVIAEQVLGHNKWAKMTELAVDGTAIVSSEGIIIEANTRAQQILRASHDQLVGSSVEQWMPEHFRARHIGLRQAYATDPQALTIDMRPVTGLRSDGVEVPLLLTVQPTSVGEESLFVVTLRDASREERLDRENRQIRAMLADATDKSVIGQLLVDVAGRVIRANTSFAQLAGADKPQDLVGRSAASLIDSRDLAVARSQLRPMLRNETQSGECELRLQRPDNTEVWARVIARILPPTDDVRVISAQVIDVSERRAAEQVAESALGDLEFRSMHDSLTGLPNRSLLLDMLSRRLARSWGTAATTSVLYCDIDNFKFVNDEFSHAAGDELLVEIADRLRSQLHPDDVLARISGDEFVVMLSNADGETALGFGHRLLAAVADRPFSIDLGSVHSTLSIGVAVSGAESDATSLIREADLALNAAKEEGRSRVRLFDASLRGRADERLLLAQSLGLALANDQIRPWLQPIVRMRDREVVGYEALARWDTGDELEIPVSEWIEVADEVGLLAPLGERMLMSVLRYLKRLPPHLWIAVNLAGSQLNPTVVHGLLKLLAESGVDARRLVVEVREKSLTRSPDSVLEGIADLTEAGIRVFFDDFGSGPSSLTTLGRVPVAGIKLDKSFTDTIDDAGGPEWRLARALSEMAISLGLETIAAGIEDTEQETELIAAGWDYGQGWLYGHAAPAEEIAVGISVAEHTAGPAGATADESANLSH